jgi:flavin reductase (DIM6/NTAB) family NADH-FMN oxidoreductase RutF
MSRISVDPGKAYHLINHGPCPLVTTGDGVRQNVAAINWTVPVQTKPPLILCVVEDGIYTNELIKASGEFVLNLLGEPHAAAILHCGSRSGRKGDKFASSGLTPVPSAQVKPPRLAQSFAHIELKLHASYPQDGVTLQVGQVVHAEVEEEFFQDGHLVIEKARTLHHLGRGHFAVAERLLTVPRDK